MTFEPTPTMIEAVWGALPYSPGKSDMAEAIKALFERLQDDHEDARVAADAFMGGKVRSSSYNEGTKHGVVLMQDEPFSLYCLPQDGR